MNRVVSDCDDLLHQPLLPLRIVGRRFVGNDGIVHFVIPPEFLLETRRQFRVRFMGAFARAPNNQNPPSDCVRDVSIGRSSWTGRTWQDAKRSLKCMPKSTCLLTQPALSAASYNTPHVAPIVRSNIPHWLILRASPAIIWPVTVWII